jgi:predicted secreted hydrolase
MDKEWSTSSLHKDQVGWDWFSLQLDDEREIMYYQLRQKDGKIDPYSSGAIIDKNGTTKPINLNEIDIEVLENWTSPLGGTYPSTWGVEIPKEDLDLKIEPQIKNQELNLSIRYWEGAVKVSGTSNGNPINGNGYVELTGYAKQPGENK